MNRIEIKLPCGDLASRHLAIAIRHKIEPFIKHGEVVHLNLSDVTSISESYSDELFGILVAKNGLERFLANVRIENANQSTLLSIAIVIKRRSDQIQRKSTNISGTSVYHSKY
ncbi:TPA: STAS-like domain-containing protein [Salmonella enterica]|uniref:STAS-like domain-containing protein n=1 Tax=Salmonella enterica TaxID=28901 RepID=A0A759YIQ9_SALER|nr:STAS-like domain-containing protein [Salmonella enterica]